MELRHFLAFCKKWVLVILGIPVVIVAATLAFSFLQTKIYTSSDQLLVRAYETTFDRLGIPRTQEVVPSASTMNTISELCNSLKTGKSVTNEVLAGTQIIQISAKDANPQTAMEMVSASADSIIAYMQKKQGNTGNITMEKVKPATKPQSPSSPKPVRNGIIGGLLGLVLGFATAGLLETTDDSVRSKGELLQQLRKPVLGVIPLINPDKVETGKRKASDGDGILEEARTLRTNIQYLDLEHNLKTILMTSPGPKEGKTFVSLQLARACAAAERKVVLVDADLRKQFHRKDETPSQRGITNIVLDGLGLADAFADTDMELLKLLPSGPIPLQPSELLGSSEMQSLLSELAGDFDVVILDSSPIGMFSDALVLASEVDGVILIAAARSTTRSSLKAAGDFLSGPNVNFLGTVFNKVKHPRL